MVETWLRDSKVRLPAVMLETWPRESGDPLPKEPFLLGSFIFLSRIITLPLYTF